MPRFTIRTLGPAGHDSPLLALRDVTGDTIAFVADDARILADHDAGRVAAEAAGGRVPDALELAGPRSRIHFDPARTGIGIVTCGGLCPGLNNVIRALVMSAEHQYGVRRIVGFRYGFLGLVDPALAVPLRAADVAEIHHAGGTILGSSRGPQDPARMVDRLLELGLQVLFVIGGDGSMRGALAIGDEARRRGVPLAVVGIPKTIDNDLLYMDQSFGFATAFGEALSAVGAAHREAQAAPDGIGLVKVMGRHSGFIACAATLASGDVNFTLIPEVPFRLEGGSGLLACLGQRLAERGHAVIVVAEGAGQEHLAGGEARDASGNVKLQDVGPFLARRITEHFAAERRDVTLKYIDPSYTIRSVPANPGDAVFCAMLGFSAVHAAMSGRTDMVVGSWHRTLVHVPIAEAVSARNRVDPTGPLWLAVQATTGQPLAFQDLPAPPPPSVSPSRPSGSAWPPPGSSSGPR